MDCRFCELISLHPDAVLRAGAHTFIVLSDPRLMKGHLLVIPKRHVEKLSELTREEREELIDETIRAEEKLLAVFPGCDISQHFRPFIPDNPLKVSHLHVHIRPRTLDDELYLAVQSHEQEIFAPATDAEREEYRKLLQA